ncbi:energy transducer TonB [Cognatiluteimonas profundi]|uniref:energy transducer TonB n=1 Tax=Cognatiluteimonas profundi TaxID=2594501 RepID=UPI001E2AEA73|nr:energy transducer TonB [Lysobacter profundi]
MVHSIRHTQRPHLEPNRIAGLAAAITLNTALLMLLLVPMSAPPVMPLPTITQVLHWVEARPKPPTPPVPVPITHTPPAAHATPVHERAATPQTDETPVITDTRSAMTIDTDIGTEPTRTIEDVSQPLPGVRLEYDRAPAPAYPRDALRAGVEGTVMLQVLVDVDGRPLRVDVQHSSGDRRLDIAARRQVLEHWHFRPAMKDGRAMQAIGLVPIAFNLGG